MSRIPVPLLRKRIPIAEIRRTDLEDKIDRRRTWADRLVIFLASGFGLGYIPGAPGTYGSVLGLLLYSVVLPAPDSAEYLLRYSQWIAALLLGGVFLADRLSRMNQDPDPRVVVVDEVLGQFLAIFLLPLKWFYLVAGLCLFRFFDVIKPFPIRRLERIRGGYGIVFDDVLAGIYANLVLHFVRFLWRDAP